MKGIDWVAVVVVCLTLGLLGWWAVGIFKFAEHIVEALNHGAV